MDIWEIGAGEKLVASWVRKAKSRLTLAPLHTYVRSLESATYAALKRVRASPAGWSP